MTGMRKSQTHDPIVSSTIDERRVKTEHTTQFTRLPMRTTRTGTEPSPKRWTAR